MNRPDELRQGVHSLCEESMYQEEEMQNNTDSHSEKSGDGSSHPLRIFLVRSLLVVIILGMGMGVAIYWMKHRPRARRRPPSAGAALVAVKEVELTDHEVVVSGMGAVEPARRIQLAARVGGEVEKIGSAFVPGGQCQQGDTLLCLDREDYELILEQKKAQLEQQKAECDRQQRAVEESRIAVEQAELNVVTAENSAEMRRADVVRAESALRIEMGQQSVAREEYELLGENLPTVDEDLVLREPQLLSARADLDSARTATEDAQVRVKLAEAKKRSAELGERTAEAALVAASARLKAAESSVRQAEIDLGRTTIQAPFNTMVVSRMVDMGSQVVPGQGLATLVGTDEYWIRVSVPVDELRWLSIPGFNSDEASSVRIHLRAAAEPAGGREGRIVRLLGELEPQGRLAQLLVSIQDPLQLKMSAEDPDPLILGSYVRAEMVGKRLERVARVSREHFRNGDSVWVMSEEDKLEIRDVTVAWSGDSHVYVSRGLSSGDRLVITDMAVPVQGMALRVRKQGRRQPPAGSGVSGKESIPSEGRPSSRNRSKKG